jgi:hypothetical protein
LRYHSSKHSSGECKKGGSANEAHHHALDVSRHHGVHAGFGRLGFRWQDPPDTQRFVDDEEQTFVFADCGDFEVRSDYTVEGAITTFYDSSGNPDYYKMHLIFHDFFYSTENPDEGFAETNVESLVVDASSDTEVTVSGLQYHVTMPGEGIVLVGAGILRFDTETGEVVFEGGPHQLESADTDKVCAAFEAWE